MKSFDTTFEIIKTKYSSNGGIIETRFNEEGRISRRMVARPDGSSEIEMYFKNGALSGRITSDKDGRKTNIRYKYGVKGKKSEEPPAAAGITQDLSAASGECWLLSGIHALNACEKGRKIIRKSIIPHTDGSVTVKFEGALRSCHITAEKIQNFASCSRYQDAYASGGADMLILELAAEKLRAGDIKKNEASDKQEKWNDILAGGSSLEIWEALVSEYKAQEIYGGNLYKYLPEILKNAADIEKNTALCFSLYGSHSAQLTNGKQFKHSGPLQEYAVSYVSLDLIKFINPWNPLTHYAMSWSEFEKLRPFNISCIDLN